LDVDRKPSRIVGQPYAMCHECSVRRWTPPLEPLHSERLFVYNNTRINVRLSEADAMEIRAQDVLEIIYMDRNGALSQRHIRVLEAKGRLLKAYCYRRKGIRLFLVDNILAWQPVKSARDAS